MDSKAQPLHQVARLAATVLMASVVSLGTGAAASAQTLKPDVPDRSAPLGGGGAGNNILIQD
jgi:hypothetical protein